MVPHTMDAEGCQMLNNFAELVVRELERDQVYHRQLKEADMSHHQVCPAAFNTAAPCWFGWAEASCSKTLTHCACPAGRY